MNLTRKLSRAWLIAGVCVLSATAAPADWLSVAGVLKKCPPPSSTAASRDLVVANPKFSTPTAVAAAKSPASAVESLTSTSVAKLAAKTPKAPAKAPAKVARRRRHSGALVVSAQPKAHPSDQPKHIVAIVPKTAAPKVPSTSASAAAVKCDPQYPNVLPSVNPRTTNTPPQTLKTAEPAQTTQATGTTGVQTASGTQIQPPKPPPAQPTAQQQSSGQKLISNVFAGTDIREALSEVASTANVTIIPDDSIKNTLVYMEFRNEPVDSAIRKLALLSGAYVKEQSPGVYLISQATPESGLFRMFSETQSFFTRNTSATAIQAMLPSAYKPFVSFDLKSNHISVTAPSELLPQILGDLRSLDKAPRQFVVEALVTEMDDTGSLNTSFSWNWKNFGVGNDLSLNYTQASQQDVATLIALIGKGKATLRANPRVTAFEGTQTSLTIGQETYFSILSGNVTFPTAQIQLIKTGVTLDFTGYIDDDGTITLNLSPEVSDAVVSVNGNPTTNVRRVSTMVRVKPGDTIAIGGLVQEISSYSTTKVPFLGYIPLIGELFTQRNNTTSKKEVVILITPHFSDSGVGQTGIDSARPAPRP